MNVEKINTKPDISSLHNGNPLPGSYIIRDGKLEPNLDDEAMKLRNEKRETKNEKPSSDKKEIKI